MARSYETALAELENARVELEALFLFAVVVVLPTPPLPDVTTITSLIFFPPKLYQYSIIMQIFCDEINSILAIYPNILKNFRT